MSTASRCYKDKAPTTDGAIRMGQAVTDNHAMSRFELAVGNQTVYADYRPPSLRGTGAAGRLMEGVMEAARAEGLKIVPLCSYAAMWMHRNRRDDLLA